MWFQADLEQYIISIALAAISWYITPKMHLGWKLCTVAALTLGSSVIVNLILSRS